MNEDDMSLVGIAEQDFEVIANIYFVAVLCVCVCVCKRVVGGKGGEIRYFNVPSRPVLGGDDKVYKTCVAVNLLAEVLSSDPQNVKQDINHYGKMIE
jgi:hypothetical protein